MLFTIFGKYLTGMQKVYFDKNMLQFIKDDILTRAIANNLRYGTYFPSM